MAWQTGMKTRMDLRLGQRMVMTPQLQQAIKLLALSRLELTQMIDLEMTENPLLEDELSDTPSSESGEEVGGDQDADSPEQTEEMELKWEDAYEDDDRERIENDVTFERPQDRPSYEQTLARAISLSDHLLWQLGLCLLSERDKAIGTDIIGNIEDNGYLETDPAELAANLQITTTEVLNVLKVIQRFDPPGVGARNLVECLLIQTELLGLSGSLVETIIKNHLDHIEKRRYAQIAKECDVVIEEVLQASKIIEHLEPKPGRPFYANDNFNIIPDVFVVKLAGNQDEWDEDAKSTGGYAVVLNDDGMPKMKISSYYRALLRSKQPGEETTRAYLKEKFQSAMWLIRSIEQRNQTILKVANSILQFQYAFMEKGVSQLKPLVLKQVAEDIKMHESTVSRVTTHKYIYTPQGIFELKYFFNGSLAGTGNNAEQKSSLAVREQIEKIVSSENTADPLTDQEIVDKLHAEGVEMARRTVSKYRAELKIASATKRRRPVS